VAPGLAGFSSEDKRRVGEEMSDVRPHRMAIMQSVHGQLQSGTHM